MQVSHNSQYLFVYLLLLGQSLVLCLRSSIPKNTLLVVENRSVDCLGIWYLDLQEFELVVMISLNTLENCSCFGIPGRVDTSRADPLETYPTGPQL